MTQTNFYRAQEIKKRENWKLNLIIFNFLKYENYLFYAKRYY